jgi:hypothetical protein
MDHTNLSMDLLFIIDATGSMGPIIEAVKKHIHEIVRKIQQERSIPIRLGVVAYRDYYDEDPTEILLFTEDVNRFEVFLKQLAARGGDDDAEDVFTGWERAASMDWKSPVRMIVHLADAPCHGIKYHFASVSDHYKNGDKLHRNAKDLLAKLAEDCQVNTFQFIHLNNSTRQMLYTLTNNEYPKDDWYKEDQLSLDNLKDMPHRISTASLECITKSTAVFLGDSAYTHW